MLRFHVSQPYDKPEQRKLLLGRKPVIQIAERPILQYPQNVVQSKTRSKISLIERSIFPGGSEQQYRVVPVTKYTIPKNSVRA